MKVVETLLLAMLVEVVVTLRIDITEDVVVSADIVELTVVEVVVLVVGVN